MARKRKEENGATEEKKERSAAEENKTEGERNRKENKPKREKKQRKKRKPLSPDCALHQAMPIVMTALAALFGICIYTQIEMGVFGSFVSGVCFGLFGGGAFLIPVWLLVSGLRWRADVRDGSLVRSQVFGLALIFLVSVFCYTFGMPTDKAAAFAEFYTLGQEKLGGGVLGGFVGYGLNFLFSKVGTVIVSLAVLLVLFLLAYGAAAKVFAVRTFRFLSRKAARMREKRREAEEAHEDKEVRRRAEKVRAESSFYDALPAIPANGGTPRADGAGSRGSFADDNDSAQKPRKRQFYDADAEDSFSLIPGGTSFSPVPEQRPQRKYPSDDRDAAYASAPERTGTPRGEGFAFSEEPEIRIVGSRPIPANRAKPFAKTASDPAASDPIPEPTPAVDEVPSEDADILDTEEAVEPIEADLAAIGEEGSADTPLVINKAHVVEHIGAETLASEEDINKHAADTFFYSFPPLSLLHEDDAFNKEDSDLEIEAKAAKLRETLHNFGVAADITCVSRGPRLTRYELVPRPGVRISKIENLVDEITMNLEAISVRIEAPIPGKAAIGVEVPNINTTTVRLRGLLDTDTFRDAPGKTTVCLGVDVVGKPVFADLDKMPHLLVAGATGMGKSVCINSLLISLLYKARPDEVKLILIDPKKVEFQSYANIPHLLVPVVTEPQKAAGALSWAVGEMERRYDLIESAAVRNIVAYNKTVDDHPGRVKMPQIVIVIDELHDLMLQARDAVEDSIARIAAKARAAGILLIIGTQRPSVNVITGVIKANIPSRIAFHVASQVDSRTILDAVGAEKLLNNGDMLFLSPGMKMMTPKRVQGAFLDDDEVNRVADYLRKNSSAVQYDESVMLDMERESEKCNKDKKQGGEFGADGDGAGGEDDLFYKAVEVALESGKISTSLLQRRLSLGFGKAARIIDRMCDLGIVSPPNGQKPREVLITVDEYRAMRLRSDE